jgi:hypothetical protein
MYIHESGEYEMKKTLLSLMIAALTVTIAWSLPALAEDTQKGKGRNMPAFTDFDLNGDGGIAEKEFLEVRSERIAEHAAEGRQMKNIANAPSFQEIDADDDGSVSPNEFAAHQAEHKAKRSQR